MPKNSDFDKIYANFISKYGEKEGKNFYYAWLNKNKLDDTKPMPKHMKAEVDTLSAAVWSTAYMNDLPDSCFAWVESGGKKDADGKTEPRSLRHLPYKTADGKIDLPHLRNAIARLGQGMPSAMSPEMRKSMQSRLQKMLGSEKS